MLTKSVAAIAWISFFVALWLNALSIFPGKQFGWVAGISLILAMGCAVMLNVDSAKTKQAKDDKS